MFSPCVPFFRVPGFSNSKLNLVQSLRLFVLGVPLIYPEFCALFCISYVHRLDQLSSLVQPSSRSTNFRCGGPSPGPLLRSGMPEDGSLLAISSEYVTGHVEDPRRAGIGVTSEWSPDSRSHVGLAS